MKRVGSISSFLLAAALLPVYSFADQSVNVKSSSVRNRLVLVEGEIAGKAAEFTCDLGTDRCSAPSPGEYVMRKATTEGIYNDCTNVVLYKPTSSGAKETVGVYCWLTSGDSYTDLSTNVPDPASQGWRWFQNCTQQTTIGIEVTVDGTSVFKSSVPICKTTNAAADNGKEKQKTLAFSFKGGRKFQGEYQTTSADTIHGNIWQAGADADDLLLGVSFDTGKQVLLNTIQIARPDRRSVDEVDTGIIVETFPIQPN